MQDRTHNVAIFRILNVIDDIDTPSENCTTMNERNPYHKFKGEGSHKRKKIRRGTAHQDSERDRGMENTQLRRLKELEQENSQLKKIVAQQALDIDAMEDLLGKEW